MTEDLNKDGVITPDEVDAEIKEKKDEGQRQIAFLSLLGMLGAMTLLASPLVTDSRVNALSSVTDVFFVGLSSIAAAYVGIVSWMNAKQSA